MSSSFDDAVSRIASQADAIGRLAQDSGGFSAVVAAFESKDANAFRWVLDRLEILPYCELICEWVRIKLCVLRCLELCDPPNADQELPSFEQFAKAVARLTQNEAGLRRIVDAVDCGNREEYAEAINHLELHAFCSLICHWVCGVGYRRVCEVVCRQEPIQIADPLGELRATGKVVAGLLENESALAAINKAALEDDWETLKRAINDANLGVNCEILCRLICFWRCHRVCRTMCVVREPILTGEYGVEEARSFALAFRKMAAQPRALGDLVNAVREGNSAVYSRIIDRYGLGPYCWQVCAWVCGVTCFEFCIFVCPPPGYPPIFQQVGLFEIYSEIDPSTGLTSTSQPISLQMPYGGGPKFAFYQQLELRGNCPIYSPTHPGAQMMYRFLFAPVATSLAAAINASQTSITVAPGAAAPATPFNISVCNDSTPSSNENAEIMTVTATAGTNWTVTRAQDGTSAAPAPAGAPVGISPAPITDNLVSPVQMGIRPYAGLWPSNVAGIAGPLVAGWSEAVMVVPNNYQPPAPSPNPGTVPPDLPPPAAGATWYPPVHYIAPDVNGWVPVDEDLTSPAVSVLLGFDTTQPGVAPGGDPIVGAYGAPGGAPAGTAVAAANQHVGVDLTIIFQATRVGIPTIDYSNSLCRIHVNNWNEVNNLWFQQFGANCCTPIDNALSVQFTVDHEMMGAGSWSLGISSCAFPPHPGSINITPPDPTVGVTFTAGNRGANGTIVEDTSTWENCSYTGSLSTRPALTTGLYDERGETNLLTFCICGH
jgi:hypothetical protein